MFYVILRQPNTGGVVGFAEDTDGAPVTYNSEKDANESMEGHLFKNSYEVIEL